MHSAPAAGRLVAGRYRLLDQLGRGAMGIVWHGRDEVLDREVAVKQVVLPPLATGDETRASCRRTLREARTAARLSHPGVITVFDVVEHDGLPWIVMELIRARPLDQVIAEDGPLPPAQAAHLGLGLLDALATAHAAGVLHRDVKPSNVLITPDGKAVLTDFGIATVQGDPGLTQAGMVAGTPGFSPPERVRGAEATPASDLWSLGATLYAAVEGRGPFDRAGGSAAIVASIATESAPRAPSAGPLAPVIDRLLSAEPAARPDTSETTRMLTAAWTAARRPARFPGSLPAPGLTAAPGAVTRASDGATAAIAGSGAAVRAEPAGPGQDVTTATQALAVGDAAAPAGGPPAGSARPAPPAGAASARGVVPDLMATPVFAELRMPDLPCPGTPASASASADPAPAGSPAPAGPSAAASTASTSAASLGALGRRVAGVAFSRRGLVVSAPLGVSALVAGIVFLAFPGFGSSLAPWLSKVPGRTLGSGASPGLRTTGPPGASHARRGSPGGQAPGGPGQAGQRQRPSPAPGSADRSGPAAASRPPGASGQPSPTASASGSPSPSPSPAPGTSSPASTGGWLPAGYAWRSVTAQAYGTTAGWRMAAPASWVLTPGLRSVIANPAGAARLSVDLATFAVASPVREARHLQAAAIANRKYRLYHLVSILAIRFHGWPAASWTFWWKPLNRPRIDVTQIIFTAQTSAGRQSCILAIAAPAAHATYASRVMRVAMRTFAPLP